VHDTTVLANPSKDTRYARNVLSNVGKDRRKHSIFQQSFSGRIYTKRVENPKFNNDREFNEYTDKGAKVEEVQDSLFQLRHSMQKN
jgi:hypothetical protein